MAKLLRKIFGLDQAENIDAELVKLSMSQRS